MKKIHDIGKLNILLKFEIAWVYDYNFEFKTKFLGVKLSLQTLVYSNQVLKHLLLFKKIQIWLC